MRRTLSLALLFSLLSCTTSSPAVRQTAATPAAGRAERVVLLSFDGLGADALAMQKGLTAFETLAKEGASARVIPVNPTVTGSTHLSILTGADPQRHGIVANRFHVAGTPVEKTAIGMENEAAVETLIDSTRRQGKRVGSISFPSIDGSTPRKTSDFGLAWTRSLTSGKIIRLTRADFHREWVPPTWTARKNHRESFSPIMRTRLEWEVPKRPIVDVDLVAYDTTDDRVENYDSFFVESGDVETALDAKGWFKVARVNDDGLHGSWSKLLQADANLQSVTIYWGPISRTAAWPEAFRSTLDGEIGFWPGEADDDAGLDPATFAEQSARLSEFLRGATVLAVERMDFDLLLAYQPQIDSASHEYAGVPSGTNTIRSAFWNSDLTVTAVWNALDLSRDALVVVGDHGVAPLDTEIRMNRLLADRGFAPRWRAYASGNIAHLYRFSGPDDSEALMKMLAETRRFENVERKGASAHPNSGDVIAVAFPNVAVNASSEAPAITRSTASGGHGASNIHRELHTVLFAVGSGVTPGLRGEMRQTQIARYISTLLGIAPPAAAE